MLKSEYGTTIQILGGPKDGDVLAFPAGARIPNLYLMPEALPIKYVSEQSLYEPMIMVREYNLKQRGDGCWVYMIGKIRNA